MESKQKRLKRRPVLFITKHSRPDRFIRAGFVNPELYDIEIKQLIPRPTLRCPGFWCVMGKMSITATSPCMTFTWSGRKDEGHEQECPRGACNKEIVNDKRNVPAHQ
jgi:hypothetical protein